MNMMHFAVILQIARLMNMIHFAMILRTVHSMDIISTLQTVALTEYASSRMVQTRMRTEAESCTGLTFIFIS